MSATTPIHGRNLPSSDPSQPLKLALRLEGCKNETPAEHAGLQLLEDISSGIGIPGKDVAFGWNLSLCNRGKRYCYESEPRDLSHRHSPYFSEPKHNPRGNPQVVL